ncbi:MAG: hypothetical protein ABI467_01745 [Kofleriaceae bacterium]
MLPELARSIVERATRGCVTPSELATQIEIAIDSLYELIASLVGTSGLIAIARRSIETSFAESGWLDAGAITFEPSPKLVGLPAAIERDGATVVLGRVRWLLTATLTTLGAFVGNELIIRLARRCWVQSIDGAELGAG